LSEIKPTVTDTLAQAMPAMPFETKSRSRLKVLIQQALISRKNPSRQLAFFCPSGYPKRVCFHTDIALIGAEPPN